MSHATEIFGRLRLSDSKAAEELLPIVYEELRKLASAKMAREQPGQTLQATALVHEAWLRLAGKNEVRFENRVHFFGAAAEAMRRILIDRARKRQVRRASGLAAPEELHESQIGVRAPEAELFALHEVLDRLAAVDATAARLVKLRYFVGLEVAEAGDAVGISVRQAERLWTFSKAWLRDAIQRER
ncbi:MAG TPA: ECF-type sigma factor [Verrucomicrobiae bacterium]|nr:ECF-type sigma factor [Verrucomicrobiae bacterium]